MEKSSHRKPKPFSVLQVLGPSTVKKSSILIKSPDADGHQSNTKERNLIFTRQFIIKSANNKRMCRKIRVKVVKVRLIVVQSLITV